MAACRRRRAGRLDTGDLVQEAALHVLGNLGTFEPRHVGAMQAYLRQSVINRICDEVRRIGRQPPPLELPDDHPCRAHFAGRGSDSRRKPTSTIAMQCRA